VRSRVAGSRYQEYPGCCAAHPVSGDGASRRRQVFVLHFWHLFGKCHLNAFGAMISCDLCVSSPLNRVAQGSFAHETASITWYAAAVGGSDWSECRCAHARVGCCGL
jgi:hypothetical protein